MKSPALAVEPAQANANGLREFQSSHLVGLLREGAAVADVALNEIAFTVEGTPEQPYQRYRAAFEVSAPYPTVRKFISHVLSGTNGVVLDTVACSRKDISAEAVTCALSFYVAYQRTQRG